MLYELEVGDVLVTKTYFGAQAHIVTYKGMEGWLLIQVNGEMHKNNQEIYLKFSNSFSTSQSLYKCSKYTPEELQGVIDSCGEIL